MVVALMDIGTKILLLGIAVTVLEIAVKTVRRK